MPARGVAIHACQGHGWLVTRLNWDYSHAQVAEDVFKHAKMLPEPPVATSHVHHSPPLPQPPPVRPSQQSTQQEGTTNVSRMPPSTQYVSAAVKNVVRQLLHTSCFLSRSHRTAFADGLLTTYVCVCCV